MVGPILESGPAKKEETSVFNGTSLKMHVNISQGRGYPKIPNWLEF